jgi:hypothetical protein
MAGNTYDMTRDEIVALIEEKAHRLGVDAREIVKAFRRGELEEWGDYAHIIALAELLDDDDPLFRS